MIFHKNHIIPKHAGGTNDSSNIIKVNVALHAFLHEQRWKDCGDKEDWIAYQGLRGLIGRDEIMKEWSTLAHKNRKYTKGQDHPAWGTRRSEEVKKQMSESAKKHKRTKEHQEKLNNRFTDEYLKRFSNSISRQWLVTFPNGDKKVIKNMAQFCRKNKLSRSGMSRSAKNNIQYKGYYCERVENC